MLDESSGGLELGLDDHGGARRAQRVAGVAPVRASEDGDAGLMARMRATASWAWSASGSVEHDQAGAGDVGRLQQVRVRGVPE